MNHLQALFDGISAEAQRERASSQMTLGKLIERIESLPDHTMLEMSCPHSYRGYYQDLAFERPNHPLSKREVLALCKGAMGEVFHGYKGGEYQMGRNTPVWIAAHGCCGMKLVGIKGDGTLQLRDDE